MIRLSETKTGKKSGFSLIELIVVITIMMVVTVIGVVSYSSVNKSARDGKRKTDLEKVRTALEMYKQQNRIYPANEALLVTGDPATTYLQAWPDDPKPTLYRYIYAQQAGGYSYYLYSYLESGGTNYGVSCAVSGTAVCNYRVANP